MKIQPLNSLYKTILELDSRSIKEGKMYLLNVSKYKKGKKKGQYKYIKMVGLPSITKVKKK